MESQPHQMKSLHNYSITPIRQVHERLGYIQFQCQIYFEVFFALLKIIPLNNQQLSMLILYVKKLITSKKTGFIQVHLLQSLHQEMLGVLRFLWDIQPKFMNAFDQQVDYAFVTKCKLAMADLGNHSGDSKNMVLCLILLRWQKRQEMDIQQVLL